MRYADHPTAECEVHIEADRDRVWDLVCDIQLPARFSPELRRVRPLDDTVPLTQGTRFEGHNHHPFLGEWRTISYVVELTVPSALAWAVVDADGRFGGGPPDPANPAATWRFDLTPDAGGTRLRHGVRIGPGRSGLSLAIDRSPEREEAIVRHRLAELRSGIQDTLDGIKRLAELG
ncbi:SRPBCC family protein [Micromonospora siamensis]|uniref:Polyketide cyclase / dehydrase and lipid transport n=1 Tax=Micromonospora siamensis TaxID=299152 RepID=A0A1C5HAC1_9ACTN|nr:SRPBCC family protein [Micromonospora siamensis]SCG42969.1 Polyketide cyclase / dehydrase and lipid transport [Micromonospora siamensis]